MGDKQTFQRIILENIKALPMPFVEDLYNTKIASFAKEILQEQKNNSSCIEKEIDMIVYKLFNLSEEEVRTLNKVFHCISFEQNSVEPFSMNIVKHIQIL